MLRFGSFRFLARFSDVLSEEMIRQVALSTWCLSVAVVCATFFTGVQCQVSSWDNETIIEISCVADVGCCWVYNNSCAVNCFNATNDTDTTTAEFTTTVMMTTLFTTANQPSTPVPATGSTQCQLSWTERRDTSYLNGVVHNIQSGNYTPYTELECKDLCIQTLTCVAAQYCNVSDSNGKMLQLCVLNSNEADKKYLIHYPGNTVYDIHRCPQTDTTTVYLPTTIPPTNMTSYIDIITSAVNTIARNDGCVPMWTNYTDTAASNILTDINYLDASVEKCLQACVGVISGCVGCQWRNTTDPAKCYFVTDLASIYNHVDSPGVTLFYLNDRCPTGAATQGFTFSTPPPTVGQVWEPVAALCYRPPTVEHADLSIIQDQFGIVAVYRCLPGFYFSSGGSIRTIVCVGSQEWHQKIEPCEAVTCNSGELAGKVDYEGASGSTITSGNAIKGSCSHGRFSDGMTMSNVKCVATNGTHGKLMPQPDTCSASACYPPPLVANATITIGPGNAITLTCYEGHRYQDGHSKATIPCRPTDYMWDPIPGCTQMVCDALKTPEHSTLNDPNSVLYGSVVNVTCDIGYFFPNRTLTKTLQCIANDTDIPTAVWSPASDVPDCIRVTCWAPPTCTSENGCQLVRPLPPDFKYGGPSIDYTCTDPFNKFEDGTTTRSLRCAEDGNWSPSSVQCSAGVCDPLPLVDNALPNSKLATSGSVAVFTCHAGYMFSNRKTTATTICVNQQWTPAISAGCIALTCKPVSVRNATVNSTSTSFMSAVTVTCDSGFQIDDNSTSVSIQCLANGNWSIDPVVCRPVDCGQIPSLSNAIPVSNVDTQTTKYGSEAAYICMAGSWWGREHDTTIATCTATGDWSVEGSVDHKKWPSCVDITCLPLGVTRTVNTTETTPGTSVSVTCPTGQILTTGKTIITSVCDQYGKWNPSVPDCTDTTQASQIILPAKEAKNADLIAGLAISVMVIGAVVIVIFDISSLKLSVEMLAQNVVEIKSGLRSQ